MSVVLYWDSSALLSALLQERHSEDAIARSRQTGLHILSSLTWAEVNAGLARMQRERFLANVLVDAAREALSFGPWWNVTTSPEWAKVRALSSKWPLRGADLWHLALAMSLREDLPGLRLLTYDEQLLVAARGEGLAVA